MTLKWCAQSYRTCGECPCISVFTIKDTKVTHFWMIKGLIAQRWYKYHSNVGFEIIKVHRTSFFSDSIIFFSFTGYVQKIVGLMLRLAFCGFEQPGFIGHSLTWLWDFRHRSISVNWKEPSLQVQESLNYLISQHYP